MKLGADPKKSAILAVLMVVLIFVLYQNVFSGGEETSTAPAARPAATAPPATGKQAAPAAPPPRLTAPRSAVSQRAATNVQEFRPSLKPKRPEDRPDPAKVDPTLRLDLLAKLQTIHLAGGERSLFDFSAAPPPKVPDVKIVPKRPVLGPEPPPPPVSETKPVEPPKAPPPPIPLRFYGFIQPQTGGVKRAFFLNGEDIVVAAEGETIKSRYKVIRIGVSSAVLEDTQHKHQQTIQMEQPPSV